MVANLDQKFKGFNGEDLEKDPIKLFIAKALFSGQGVGNSEDEKFNAYKLCNRLMNENTDSIELDKDERKLILSAACATLSPGAYGQVRELLTKEDK